MNKFSSYLKKKKPLARLLIDELSKKYDFASILATDVKSTDYQVNFQSSAVSDGMITECGFVVRIFKDNNFYEYSFNELEKKNFSKIIDDIDKLVNTKVAVNKVKAVKPIEEELTKKFLRKHKGNIYTDEEVLNILKDNLEYGKSLGDNILNVNLAYSMSEYSKMYLSNKRDLEQYYTWSACNAYIVVKNDSTMKYAYNGYNTNDSDLVFKKLKEVIDDTYKLACELLDATTPTPGIYTIITDPSITGLIAHEAFGHGLEMDQFVKDRAKSVEYMNKKVASPILSMRDGAASAYSVASYFFDDEGVLAQDTKIIDKGILVGGICDSVSGSILSYKPTGNGRRQSYKNKVYTRMTNTFFEKGTNTLDEMIKSVDYGYYIGITNNGMEDPKNWGIQCTALYGKEIKDGKFTGKIVSPVVMSGYVIDLLNSISMISKENFHVDGGGFCGKGYKEWVQVSDGGSSIKAEVKIG